PPKKDDAKPAGGEGGPDANKDKAEDDEPAGPDPADIEVIMGRGRNPAENRFRIGLRQGENEIVVKVVVGSGPGAGGPRGVFGGRGERRPARTRTSGGATRWLRCQTAIGSARRSGRRDRSARNRRPEAA